MSYQEHLAADRRLCILRLLADLKGSANDSILHSFLEGLGHVRIPRDDVRDDLRFLSDHGLITVEWYKTVMVAELKRRGLDLIESRIQVDGVKSPSIVD